jgi:hypothetical protein
MILVLLLPLLLLRRTGANPFNKKGRKRFRPVPPNLVENQPEKFA